MQERNEENYLLKRAFGPLERLLELSVIVMFIVVMIEVVMRYILHGSVAWSSEVCETLLVWLAFVGGAVALLYDEHMRISFLVDNIKTTALRKPVFLVGIALTVLFLISGIIGGAELVRRTWNMTTTTLQIPAGIMYAAFPVGCLLMLIVTLSQLLSALKKRGD